MLIGASANSAFVHAAIALSIVRRSLLFLMGPRSLQNSRARSFFFFFMHIPLHIILGRGYVFFSSARSRALCFFILPPSVCWKHCVTRRLWNDRLLITRCGSRKSVYITRREGEQFRRCWNFLMIRIYARACPNRFVYCLVKGSSSVLRVSWSIYIFSQLFVIRGGVWRDSRVITSQ